MRLMRSTIALLLCALFTSPAFAANEISDLGCETTATTGQGTLSLGGAASGGYLGILASGITSGATIPYRITSGTGSNRKIEVGMGVFTDAATDTLTRASNIVSTDGIGTKLTLTGTSTVCLAVTSDLLTTSGWGIGDQTPWASAIDGAGFDLTGAGNISATGSATFTIDQNEFTISDTSDDNDGPDFTFFADSSSPVAADSLGWFNFRGRDSAGNSNAYASWNAYILDTTNGSEDGYLSFNPQVAGSRVTQLAVNDGVIIGNNSSSFLGSGSLQMYSTDGSGIGLKLYITDAAQLCSFCNIGEIGFRSLDSTGSTHSFAGMIGSMYDKTNGSEDGGFDFYASVAGSIATRMSVGDGVVVGDSQAFPGDGNVAFESGKGIYDDSANEWLKFSKTSSAVNEFTIANAATTGEPTLSVTGGDGDVGMKFLLKSTTQYEFTGSHDFTFDGGATAEYPSLTVISHGADDGGPYFSLYHDSVSPAANDETGFNFSFNDSAGNAWNGGQWKTVIVDPTNGSEDSYVKLDAFVAGSQTNQITFGNGVSISDVSTLPGTGNLAFATGKGIFDGAGNEELLFTQTASAVNEFTIANAATGSYPTLSATGGDTNIGFVLTTKGAPATALTLNAGDCDFCDGIIIRNTSQYDGSGLIFDQVDSTPAVLTGGIPGSIQWRSRDTAANVTGFVEVDGIVLDGTDGSEDGAFNIGTRTAGTYSDKFKVADGVIIGTGTTYPGAGNLSIGGTGGITFTAGASVADTETDITFQSPNSDAYIAHFARTFNDDLLFGNTDMFLGGAGSGLLWASNISIADADNEAIRSRADAFIFPQVQYHADAANGTQSNAQVALHRWSADAVGGNIAFAKSRANAIGTYTVVQSGDVLGEMLWNGSDGTDNEVAAGIRAIVDTTPGADDMPGALVFATTADGAVTTTDRMTIKNSGHVLVGSTTTAMPDSNWWGATPQFQVIGTSDNTASMGVWRFSAGGTGAVIDLSKANSNTPGTYTVVTDGTDIGYLFFNGSDGTDLEPAASITVSVDGTPGNNDMPGRITFSTTADGAASPTDRWKITNAGNFLPVTPGASAGVIRGQEENITVAASDEVTALTTGTGKVTFRNPYNATWYVTGVKCSLTTAQSSGNIFTVDINEAGTTILSTKITIDNTEKTSTTPVTPPVISDSSIASDAELSIDIDQVGASADAAGLKCTLIGHQ